MSALTDDRFLSGRVIAQQTERGFRSGLDAVMLAAAVPAGRGDSVLELGSGAGVASLCLAARVGDCTIAGAEIDPALAALANANAKANRFEARLRFFEADAFALPADLKRGFTHVICNPPFHGEGGEVSPDSGRARALSDNGRLADWLAAGLKRVASGGTFTTIIRADRLGEALAALPQTGVAVFPLWPRTGVPAKRTLLRVRRDSREPLALLAGLVLHESNGGYTTAADAVLRDGKALDLG